MKSIRKSPFWALPPWWGIRISYTFHQYLVGMVVVAWHCFSMPANNTKFGTKKSISFFYTFLGIPWLRHVRTRYQAYHSHFFTTHPPIGITHHEYKKRYQVPGLLVVWYGKYLVLPVGRTIKVQDLADDDNDDDDNDNNKWLLIQYCDGASSIRQWWWQQAVTAALSRAQPVL